MTTDTTAASGSTIEFTKVHGSSHAYLVHIDPENTDALQDHELAALADPVWGISATSIIRIVPASLMRKMGADWYVQATSPTGRPSVISPGVLRAAAFFLHRHGYVNPQEGDSIALVTDDGRNQVRYSNGEYGLTVGAWRAFGGKKTLDDGFNATVAVGGLSDPRPGLQLLLEGTHTVVALETPAELAELNFDTAPRVEPAGESTVSFIVPIGERDVELTGGDGQVIDTEKVGAAQLRVAAPTGQEVRSDDRAVAAAAVAVRNWLGQDNPSREWVIITPGGQQRVMVRPSRSITVAESLTASAQVSWPRSQPEP